MVQHLMPSCFRKKPSITRSIARPQASPPSNSIITLSSQIIDSVYIMDCALILGAIGAVGKLVYDVSGRAKHQLEFLMEESLLRPKPTATTAWLNGTIPGNQPQPSLLFAASSLFPKPPTQPPDFQQPWRLFPRGLLHPHHICTWNGILISRFRLLETHH